jgi:hypothetical protein
MFIEQTLQDIGVPGDRSLSLDQRLIVPDLVLS